MTLLEKQISEARQKYLNLQFSLIHGKHTAIERTILEKEMEKYRIDIVKAQAWLKICSGQLM